MARQVAEGVHWIQECGTKESLTEEFGRDPPDWYEPGRAVHNPIHAYLVVGERTLLFDTISPASRGHLLSELDSILDGRDLDYVVASHTEPPHAGNALAVCREHPEAELVAPSGVNMHELYYLGDATLVDPGDEIDLGDGHLVEFKEATFPDGPTVWAFDHGTETLFTVDWFGNLHHGGECMKCADEVEGPFSEHRLINFHGRALFWLEYADTEKTHAEIEHLVRTVDPSVVAPAHGFPIREDVAEGLQTVKPVIERISEHGRKGVFL